MHPSPIDDTIEPAPAEARDAGGTAAMGNRMTGERVKIVVWDSIGNTLLGVRPWASWDAPIQETLLRENPAAEDIALPLQAILAGHDVDLTWFNSADAPYAPFGQLYADYEGSLRFTRSLAEIE